MGIYIGNLLSKRAEENVMVANNACSGICRALGKRVYYLCASVSSFV